MTIREELSFGTSPGNVEPLVIVEWGEPEDGPVTGYEIQFRHAANALWFPPVVVREPRFVSSQIGPGTWDFRVRPMNAAGAFGPWVQRDGVPVSGLLAPPQAVTGFAAEPHEGTLILSWDLSPDLDVRIGGRFEVRRQEVTSAASWDEAAVMVAGVPGTSTTITVPLLTGTWLIRAVDSSGIAGPVSQLVLDSLPALTGFQAVSTETEDPSWTGTRDGTFVEGAILKLGGGALIDDWGDIDDVEDFDTEGTGGGVRSGTYLADFGGQEYLDLGAVMDLRLTHSVEWSRTDPTGFIDQITDHIDEWPDIDRTEAQGTGNVEVQVRTTEDDPAGSPVWSAWGPLTDTLLRARAVQVRLRLSVTLAAHTVEVSAFSLTVWVPERAEHGSAVPVTGAGLPVSFAAPFQAAPAVAVQMLNPSPGDYAQVTAVTASGFTVYLRNSGGTAISGTIDWIARGWGRAA